MSASGPDWVASVVDAIGTSSFWASTAIVIYWDDWGGFYDHVAPPQLGVDGFGFRTPMMVISPYAKSDYISHAQYESTSVVKFIETTFGIPTLTAADARATNLYDCFDFTKAPRPFVPFATQMSPSSLIRRLPSSMPSDTD